MVVGCCSDVLVGPDPKMRPLDSGDGDLLWIGSSLVFLPLQLALGLGSKGFLKGKGARNNYDASRHDRCCGSFLVNSPLYDDRYILKAPVTWEFDPTLVHIKFDPHYLGGSVDQVLGRGIHIIFQGPCCFTGGLENGKF